VYSALYDVWNLLSDKFIGWVGDDTDWSVLGKTNAYGKRHIGLYAWIDKAIDVAVNQTIGGPCTWPSSIVDDMLKCLPPPSFTYEQTKKKIICRTGDAIPCSGIWNPFDYKSGCPSFLVQGRTFPKIDIATIKHERSEFIDDDGDYRHSFISFDYEERETQWELLWEDTR
jgi:hypothetical protein